MIPTSMILPVLRAKNIQPEEGRTMARDLFQALSPADREYIDALIEHFYLGWDDVMHPLPGSVPMGVD